MKMQKADLPKTALITGGSNGIGLAIARKFADNNIKVAIADVKNYTGENPEILYKECDVSNGVEIDELYNWTTKNLGHPEILVINAGRGIREKLTEGDPEKWQQIINTNIMGALRPIRAFLPHMIEKKRGSVVVISSVAAGNPHPYGGIYSATKSALEVIAETLRLETIPHINVTVISPGVTNTEFFQNQMAGGHSIEELDMGMIAPEEIAEDVFYSISKKNGTSINKIITRPTAQSF